MGNKLFVGGLSWDTNDATLRAAFASCGDVADAKVISDRETGRSRGFGFVTMGEKPHGEAAIAALNGSQLDGRAIVVNEAQPRPPKTGGFGGGGGGGGGFRGGRGGGGGGFRGGRGGGYGD